MKIIFVIFKTKDYLKYRRSFFNENIFLSFPAPRFFFVFKNVLKVILNKLINYCNFHFAESVA